jgi:hypothetical protein
LCDWASFEADDSSYRSTVVEEIVKGSRRDVVEARTTLLSTAMVKIQKEVMISLILALQSLDQHLI